MQRFSTAATFGAPFAAAPALNHPNICTVHEIAETEGKTFIAMAFLEGEGLDKKIEAGPLKLKDLLDIAIQTAKGLQAAHAKNVVHHDIKPANLMVGEDGHVTIMDFGLIPVEKLQSSGAPPKAAPAPVLFEHQSPPTDLQ